MDGPKQKRAAYVLTTLQRDVRRLTARVDELLLERDALHAQCEAAQLQKTQAAALLELATALQQQHERSEDGDGSTAVAPASNADGTSSHTAVAARPRFAVSPRAVEAVRALHERLEAFCAQAAAAPQPQQQQSSQQQQPHNTRRRPADGGERERARAAQAAAAAAQHAAGRGASAEEERGPGWSPAAAARAALDGSLPLETLTRVDGLRKELAAQVKRTALLLPRVQWGAPDAHEVAATLEASRERLMHVLALQLLAGNGAAKGAAVLRPLDAADAPPQPPPLSVSVDGGGNSGGGLAPARAASAPATTTTVTTIDFTQQATSNSVDDDGPALSATFAAANALHSRLMAASGALADSLPVASPPPPSASGPLAAGNSAAAAAAAAAGVPSEAHWRFACSQLRLSPRQEPRVLAYASAAWGRLAARATALQRMAARCAAADCGLAERAAALAGLERAQVAYQAESCAALLGLHARLLRPEQSAALLVASWPHAPSLAAVVTGLRALRAQQQSADAAAAGAAANANANPAANAAADAAGAEPLAGAPRARPRGGSGGGGGGRNAPRRSAPSAASGRRGSTSVEQPEPAA